MITPEPYQNPPPDPITLEYLAWCIIGLNGRVDGLNGRVEGLNGRIEGFNGRIDGLNGRIDGLNSRMDSLEARVSTIESDMKDLRAGQRHILVALITIGGAIIATLGGGMVAGIFALLSVLGGTG